MVSPCANNGPAQPIPGAGLQVVLTSAAIESTLVLLGLEPAAAALGPILAGVTFDLTQLCSADPPADPGLTGIDVLAAADFTNPVNQVQAAQKVYQWFKHFYWYYACECTSGSTPPPPTPSNPGNPISTNTGLPVASQPSQCWDQSQVIAVPASPNPPNAITVEITDQLVPLTQEVTTTLVINGQNAKAQVIPPGAKSVTLTITNTEHQNVGGQTFALQVFDSGGNIVQPVLVAHIAAATSTTTATATLTLPPTAFSWHVEIDSNDNVAHNPTLELAYTCTGGTNIFQQPCCPPDPALSSQINQILQMVQAIYLGLPVPLKSYADATAHAGLAGNGTVNLASAALAIRVDITTDANHGEVIGDPTYLFDRGFIVPIVNGAPTRSESRLVYNPQLYVLPTLTEEVGYSLTPGVIVTITELIAGP